MHVLILGGTTEASELASLLAARPELRATLSLAGRTKQPHLPPIACRIGGFGGADGLAAWMKEHRVTALIDATHPFAGVMPFNAANAALQANIPLLGLSRPAWQPEMGDQWQEVDSHASAMAVLGVASRRVFLTIGRLEVDAYASCPQHCYLVRTIDPVELKCLPHAVWLTARGPFNVEDERKLLEEYEIQIIITKNSGGSATKAKLLAARALGLPVILVRRPLKPDVERVESAEAAMGWIDAML